MILAAFTASEVFRIFIVLEIFFGAGFLAARLWIHRHNPFQYLSLMAFSLLLYSFAAASGMIVRYNYPITWRTPIVAIAATIALVAIFKGEYVRGKNEEEEK
jgi:hypothetical protein